jgi:hypothetical protein
MVICRKKITIIIVIAFIVFLISCGNSEEDTSHNKEEKIDENIINVINPLETIKIDYELGKVETTDIETLKYKLINKSEEVLIIYYAETSCGCTIATLEDENKSEKFAEKSHGKIADMELGPNENLDINIELDFSDEPIGEGSKIVNVFNDYQDLIAEIEVFYFVES